MVIRRLLFGLLLAVMLAGVTSPLQAQSPNVREAQQHLGELGYAPGAADGYVGPATRGAISAFQRDNDLPVTGVLDDLSLRAIRDSVINQTLFGGAVTLEIERPEPEIVPLNPDGSATAGTSPSPESVQALRPDAQQIGAGQPASPQPTVVPIEEPSAARPRVATDITDIITVPGVAVEDRADAPGQMSAADGPVLPLPELKPDFGSKPGTEPALDLDSLPKLDLDSEIIETAREPVTLPAGPPPATAPSPDIAASSATASSPGIAPTSDLAIADRVGELIQGENWWMIVVAVLAIGMLLWSVGRRFLGDREPKRVAMTRAEYLASAGGRPIASDGSGRVGGLRRAESVETIAGNHRTPVSGPIRDVARGPGPDDTRRETHRIAPAPTPRIVDPAPLRGLSDTRPRPIAAGAFSDRHPLGGSNNRRGHQAADAPNSAPLSRPPHIRPVGSASAGRSPDPIERLDAGAPRPHRPGQVRQADAPRIVDPVDRRKAAIENGPPTVDATTIRRIDPSPPHRSDELFDHLGRNPDDESPFTGRTGASDGGMVRPPRREGK